LKLKTLLKIEPGTYSLISSARYYACVDFTEGEVRLDLDLYVSKEDGEHKVSEVVIHKVNGESR